MDLPMVVTIRFGGSLNLPRKLEDLFLPLASMGL
jgi:hypothetical protein